MNNKILVLILAWSLFFVVWALADPPSGAPGTTSGLISAYNNKVGINTSAPATLLDVNGTTTIRKTLDVVNNPIINVATPINGTDAVNKNYVDSQTGGQNSSKLWGEGRAGVSVRNTAGECTRSVSGRTIKISRGNTSVTWDSSPAGCPAGWWVCSGTERGSVACPASGQTVADSVMDSCVSESGVGNHDHVTRYDYGYAWVTDKGTAPYHGEYVAPGGGAGDATIVCASMLTLCCQYQ